LTQSLGDESLIFFSGWITEFHTIDFLQRYVNPFSLGSCFWLTVPVRPTWNPVMIPSKKKKL